MSIPDKLQELVTGVWGEKGKIWLSEIPLLLKYFADKWQLQGLKPFNNLSYNYVVSGYSLHYKSPIVLKLMADKRELFNEQRALLYYKGNGCIKLFDSDFEKGALLLETVEPGNSLSTLFPENDDKATFIAVDVIRKLHSAPLVEENNYPTIGNWLSVLDRFNHSLIPGKSIEAAQELVADLLRSQDKLYLLHGDLHHGNILLKNNDEGIAIDPKGVVGGIEYEIGVFLRNPFMKLLKEDNVPEIISERIHLFADNLKLDPQRILKWGYIQSVLAACWAIEDNLKNIQDFLSRIKLFENVKAL